MINFNPIPFMNRLPRLATLACLGLALSFGSSALRAEESLPQLRSVLIDSQAPMFSLADGTGSGRWVKIGESFEGWKLESFDAAKQILVVSRDGQTRELGLEAATLKDEKAQATVAEADAVLQKMRFEEMIGKAMEAQQKAMAKSMSGMMGKNLPPEEQAKMTEFQQKMMAVMFAEMDIPGMRQDVAKVYAETFSSAELKAQSDFYSTPAGQAMIDKQPVIQERMTELMMPRMMKAMPKVQAMAQDFAKEQRAAAAAKAAPQAAPAAKPAP
jgi:uncharacterized protein